MKWNSTLKWDLHTCGWRLEFYESFARSGGVRDNHLICHFVCCTTHSFIHVIYVIHLLDLCAMPCNSSTPNHWLVQSNCWISPRNIGAIIWPNFCSLPMQNPVTNSMEHFHADLKAPHFPFLWYIILPHKLSILHAITFFLSLPIILKQESTIA